MSSGCGDVLSLADLQTAKKHQIFEAEVITGKSGGVATGADIDFATNPVTGQTQKTLPAVLRDAGFSPVSWDFATGGTLTVSDRDKVVYDPVSETWYSYAGTLPVTVPAGFNPVGNADWKPQTDPDLRSDLTAPSSGLIVDASNIFIKASSPGTKDVPLNTFAGQMVSLLNFQGVVADGITDTRAGVQAAIDACALAGVTLYIPDGVYAFGNFFTQPSNSKLVFGENAWFKLLNNTTWPGLGGIGHFHNTGTNYNDFLNTGGETIKYVEATNVVTVGMKLDCNNIEGENGISSAWGSNIRHIRPIVKNTVHTNTALGGRAFQIEGELNQDIVVSDATIIDCSIGCNSQGLAGSTTANTRAVTYDGIFMKNVGVPFNIDGQVSNPETADGRVHSVTAYNVTLHNCGGPKAPFASQLDGGIICGDRGAGLAIYGLRLINEDSYGGIGAVFRGVIYNVAIHDADLTAPYISAIVDHTPPGFGSPSLAALGGFVSTRNVKVNANIDYIANGPNNSIGPHSLRLDIDMAKASITTLFGSSIASDPTTLAMVEILDTNTGTSSGYRSFGDIYREGNSPSVCIKRKDSIGPVVPVDASGASLPLTPNGVQRFVRNGNTVTISIDVTYPTTADSRPATISGIPVPGVTGVNYCGIGTVLNGAAVGTIAVVKGGENFIRLLTPTGSNTLNSDLSGKNISISLTYMF